MITPAFSEPPGSTFRLGKRLHHLGLFILVEQFEKLDFLDLEFGRLDFSILYPPDPINGRRSILKREPTKPLRSFRGKSNIYPFQTPPMQPLSYISLNKIHLTTSLVMHRSPRKHHHLTHLLLAQVLLRKSWKN